MSNPLTRSEFHAWRADYVGNAVKPNTQQCRENADRIEATIVHGFAPERMPGSDALPEFDAKPTTNGGRF